MIINIDCKTVILYCDNYVIAGFSYFSDLPSSIIMRIYIYIFSIDAQRDFEGILNIVFLFEGSSKQFSNLHLVFVGF